MRITSLLAGALLLSSLMATAQFGGGRGGFDRGPQGPRVEPEDLAFEDGVAGIPDRETFERLSYIGEDVGMDPYLANLEYVKFLIEKPGTEEVKMYFMNTNRHRGHPPFMNRFGISREGVVRGAITYLPKMEAPNGEAGLYIFDFQPRDSYPFESILTFQKDLIRFMPMLEGRLAFHPLPGNLERYEREREKYEGSEVTVHLDEDLLKNIAYLPLNPTESVGYLRIFQEDQRPSSRDIVIFPSLPNQLSRVAGVITEERQTPLSHVNLRAVQDRIPNAYIKNAAEDPRIAPLLGKIVRFRVSSHGFDLQEATLADMERHFEDLRPKEEQTPDRDLSITRIRPLDGIGFEEASAFGSKAANLGAMHKFGMEEGVLPEGYGIPFHFYAEFMEHNGLQEKVEELLGETGILEDRDRLRDSLKELRTAIRAGSMPEALHREIGQLQDSFAQDVNLRCRSSTNNEDLPRFSGAGLYGSYTHRPEEGHLSRTVIQVFSSLWNLRAFEERQFHRIDHRLAAMGVLVHPSYRGEKANGVAVTDDILYETAGNYYLNTQIGEDLVTNPEERSTPEEILLNWEEAKGHTVVQRSNRAPEGTNLLDERHIGEMRDHLALVHYRFASLHGVDYESEGFAMEIEYKITSDDRLVIKQARPWVY